MKWHTTNWFTREIELEDEDTADEPIFAKPLEVR